VTILPSVRPPATRALAANDTGNAIAKKSGSVMKKKNPIRNQIQYMSSPVSGRRSLTPIQSTRTTTTSIVSIANAIALRPNPATCG
jgi:hypothetical protein